ncbi:MAG: hypothetical protein ACO397_06220 [Gammaproteobacteria bacterium]|jgi:hypothetical protein
MVELHIDELQKLMSLDGVNKKIIPFHSKHLWLINMREHEKKYFKYIPNYESYLAKNTIHNASYTGLYFGSPVVSFGLLNIFPGVAEAWLIPSKELNLLKVALPFHKATKAFFANAFRLFNLRRIQCTVDISNKDALKWIETMLFTREGIMKKFGPEGTDYVMYSRIKQ